MVDDGCVGPPKPSIRTDQASASAVGLVDGLLGALPPARHERGSRRRESGYRKLPRAIWCSWLGHYSSPCEPTQCQ
jgi:hypothetical protein